VAGVSWPWFGCFLERFKIGWQHHEWKAFPAWGHKWKCIWRGLSVPTGPREDLGNCRVAQGEAHPGPKGWLEFSRGWSGPSESEGRAAPGNGLGNGPEAVARPPRGLRSSCRWCDYAGRGAEATALCGPSLIERSPRHREQDELRAQVQAFALRCGMLFPGAARRTAAPCLLRPRLNSHRPCGPDCVLLSGLARTAQDWGLPVAQAQTCAILTLSIRNPKLVQVSARPRRPCHYSHGLVLLGGRRRS
jgi:hypothetical protein